MTVLCVNPNPAIDRVAVVNFRRGGTLRPLRSFEWPGGSGVHAGLVAKQLGSQVEVISVVGGDYGKRFIQLAEENKLIIHPVWNSVETRSTFTLIDSEQGNICDIAEYGGKADSSVAESILATFERHVNSASVCVLSGSLLSDLAPNLYQSMVRLASTKDLPVIVDATGEALLATTREPVFMVKASLEELSRDGVLGSEVDAAAVLGRISEWLKAGVKNICVSLGSSGALWAFEHGMKLLSIVEAAPFNTVGCGDSLVGAVAADLDQGMDLEHALISGIAAATTNLAYDAPGYCTREDVTKFRKLVRIENANLEKISRAIQASRPK